MKYAQLREFDTTNGPGVRVSLFVSGCTLHCKGCFNPESWDFDAGDDFNEKTIERIIELLKRPYMSGLSVLGGDPFEEQNIGPVTELCKRVREACLDKTIWIWTGRKYEHFKDHEIMRYIDTLVDGPYVEKLKVKEQGQYFGSTNQRVIPKLVKHRNDVQQYCEKLKHGSSKNKNVPDCVAIRNRFPDVKDHAQTVRQATSGQ